MRGLSPNQIREIVERDVERVKRHASVTITMLPDQIDGYAFYVDEKPLAEDLRRGTHVIAIVGAGRFEQMDFEKAVLCLINVGGNRPDRKKRRPCLRNYGLEKIGQRKWFSMSQEQYLAVAPILFRELLRYATARIRNWKNPLAYSKVKVKMRGVEIKMNFSPKNRGFCFAVSSKERYLMQDLCLAEMYLNEKAKKLIDGLAFSIKGRLQPYLRERPATKDMWRLKSLAPIKSALLRHAVSRGHLLIEMMRRHFTPQYPYWDDLIQVLGWNGTEESERKKLASMALPDPKRRLGDIQLRIVKIRQRAWKGDKKIVFMVHPPTPALL